MSEDLSAEPAEGKSERPKGNLKFILTFSGQMHEAENSQENHPDVAARLGIPKEQVACGGVINYETRTISGTSNDFGPYDTMRDLLVQKFPPPWHVLGSE